MRYNWTKGAFEAGLNQFTPPEKIVDFINQYPGMHDACLVNLDYLALYAPQLFFQENEFKEKFKELCCKSKQSLSSITFPNDYECALTIDHKAPSCNRLYALADESFGRYTSVSVLRHFIEGEQLGPAPGPIDYWTGLIMLSSSYADLYPEKVKRYLLDGYRSNYSALQLSKIFIDNTPQSLAKIFNDVALMKQAIEEILPHTQIDISSQLDIIAQRICDLGLTEKQFEKRSFRITIPSIDLKYGFRGITDQNIDEKEHN